MLFFIKMKLSSRLCLTHKRVTQKYRNSTLIKKKKKKKIGSELADTQNFLDRIGSDLKKLYRCIPTSDHNDFCCTAIGRTIKPNGNLEYVFCCIYPNRSLEILTLAAFPLSGRTVLRTVMNGSSCISPWAWYGAAQLQTILGTVRQPCW